jgi:hypothetical protein
MEIAVDCNVSRELENKRVHHESFRDSRELECTFRFILNILKILRLEIFIEDQKEDEKVELWEFEAVKFDWEA